ncbi:hypothetical protein J5H37_02310 [Stenotrophomonas maltophilia]|uniref:hypothetical protein n=1 Tax=Stenotrophomonas maltophilia TaxID=40324 RepID=UPI0019D4E740|nr:hypothetical protein [Stenotrophomonas maltophilia]MBN7828356.1 hypothetical protein [Stenotrophomonas maltophilia]MBN7832347.1 hypothetical protein [Stenotrophomonas maltophilia]MBN7856616.1 hypothetical protein [Stenotrophomonas maltophilia]MBN7915829.1 hypothetical protein [Stenotrophomonas maltophilia]MBO2843780.1 hypothetical protein [Stenotrophomonas maltophilia]
MSNDNKTLADVQPGGRVRLGDQAERARFEEWYVQNAFDYVANPIGSRDCALMRKAWNAALSAQPSPGGQGETLVTDAMVMAALQAVTRETLAGVGDCDSKVIGVLTAYGIDGAVDIPTMVRAMLEAALAARQPARQEPTMPMGHDDCPVTGLPFYDNMEHPERGLIAMYGGPLDVNSVPELQDNDGELRRERYDLDADCWVEGGEPLGYFYREQQPDAAPVGEPVEHDCANCDRRHAEVICPTCAGVAWDNGRLHEFHEVRELSTSLGEGVLDLLLPDEWHEKPLLRFQGAHDEGDDSVGISPRSANVLADDQTGTVLGDYLAARAAKEGGQ